ncbi:MAG: family 43 glycosylhydrolase [Erysipelotrichaceae bacterium]|nr:family 43 glycosylhydrolase [Erysipelotrichaceae bacterium]MBQ1521319.1 family 43 glycosylhydrolase [Erysipelotrichaceae bacterium]
MYSCFTPGKPWLDTDGNPIQAHGGYMYYENSTYYWIGENKEFTDGVNGIWHNGVRCYSSEDLYNWNSEGIIIPADEDENSTLNPKSCMDRPHILFNDLTGKYVCYLKIMENNGSQSMTVLTADHLLGPYTKIREHFHPFGFNCGDFDLVKDESGRAYWYFEKVHSEMICCELTDDYLDVKDGYTVHFPHPEGVPYVREAPAHFLYENRHFLVTSGTSGYYPNPSEVAVGNDYHGPFEVVGNVHVNDETHTSFHSQISCVFKVRNKENLFIAMADRWLVDAMNVSYETVEKVFRLYAAGEYEKALDIVKSLDLPPENTSKAAYVWLPIEFENGRPVIRWYETWRWQDF